MSNEVSQAALDRTKEITDKLEAGLKALFEGDNFRNYLNTMSKFHNYSFNNTMLIALQKPDATYVAGFNSWKKNFERSVNKGEKGIKIFAPAPYKMKKEQTKIDPDTELPVLDKDGKPVIEEVEVTIPAFKVVSVFDVSQTNGKELPTLGVDELKGDVENFEKFFGVLKEVSPVPIKFDDIDGSAKGFYHHEDKAITVKTGMSDVQTIKTAIHEIAHAKLHDRDLVKADIENPKKDRNTEEVEAESIAYTVCQHFGIDTSDYSFAYVASWGSGIDTPELKSSLETIRSTASELITQISNRLRELDKERTAEQAVESAKENNISAPENPTIDNSTAEKQKNSNIIGNTPYKDIPNKFYIKIPTESVPDIEKLFESEKVSYSGRKAKSTTTITINEADYMNVSSLLANAGIKPLQESIPTVKKSLVPLYTKDRITAKENGETAECLNSFKENRSCAAAIDKALNENYSENRLDTDKALNTVVEQFGIERVNHVLAAQVVNHDWDGRYHNDVKAWAKEQMKDYSAEFIEDSRSYYLNAHPVLIDGLASKAMVRQNEIGLDKSADSQKDLAEKPRETVVINAFGGAGAGKTTACMHIAAELKKKGFVAEYVPEYAKELVWDKNFEMLDGSEMHQRMILSEQSRRMERLVGQVDFIVTDAPTLLNGVYLKDCDNKENYCKMLLDNFNTYNNFNFVVQRDPKNFEKEGRIHTLEESIAVDGEVEKLLKDNNLFFGKYDHAHLDTVVQNSIKTYEKLNGVQQPQRKQAPKQERATVKQNEIGFDNSRYFHKDAEEHQRKTIVINAFGGAGAGKTTAALSIAAELKKKGFVTEYVPEYAKELILSNNLAALDGSMENQRKVYEEQKNRIDRCIGKVDFIVTDCPIIISGMFLNDCPEKEDFQKEILEQFNKNENFSFVIQRDETKFEQENRMGTFEEAKAMDDDIQKYLKDNNVQFGCYDHAHLDTVVQNSIKTYERINGVQHPLRKQAPKQEQDKNIIGNTAYKDISEKYFVKMTAEKAQQLAPVLIQNGVRFSGRINGDKATLTIDKSDVELYKTLSASKEDILKSKRENVINAMKEYENAENFQKTAEEAMAVVMQEYDELVDENGEIQDPEIKAAMMEKIRSAYTVAQSAENNLNQKESELSMASAEFEALTKDNEPEIASTEEAAPVQPESESKWRMYVIPDLKTWADNGKTAMSAEDTPYVTVTPFSKVDFSKIGLDSEKKYTIPEFNEVYANAEKLYTADESNAMRVDTIAITLHIGDNKHHYRPVLGAEYGKLSAIMDDISLTNSSNISITKQSKELVAEIERTAQKTPIEYFNTFAEAKERFDVLRNQNYNSEKATLNGLPAARLTLGIDSNSKMMAFDILHVRDNQNVLVDDFTRYESVLNDKEAMALILQTSEEIGFNSVMSYPKLENGKFADKPEFIPFEKWDNPVLPKKQTNEKAVVQTENGSMLYTQSFDYAQKHSESKEFQASHKENMRCLWDIKATAEIYAAEGRMDKFLQDLTSEYGVERPLYVLSRTIQSVDDKRFSPEAKQIADKFDYPDIGQVHSFTHLYVTDIKPSVIDEMVCKLNNMQQEAEIISEEPKYTGEFPDESVSIKDMESFGYMFLPENEMLPLSTEKAVELFDKGANIYLLYPDNTEGQVDSRSDILNSKGCMFGIERKDFENFTAFEQLKQQIAEKEPERMEKLLNSDDKVTVGIFQLKDEPSTRRLMFSSFDEVGGEVLRDNYNLVYSLEEKDFSDKNMLLESMFAKFNGDYPEDYQGRSVSMSDVIAVNDHGNLSVHYVDRLGFKDLDNFLEIQRAAEHKQEKSDKNEKAPEEKPVQKPTKLSKTAAHKKQEEKRPSIIGAINEIKKKSQQQSNQQPTNTKGINELC